MPQNPDSVEDSLLSGGSSDSESIPAHSGAEPQPAVGETALATTEVVPDVVPDVVAEPDSTSGNGGGDSPPFGLGGIWGGDEPPHTPEMARMSFFDHLEELRRRIFYALIGIVVGMGVCWGFADEIYAGLARPLTTVLREMKMDDKLVYTNPTDVFNLYIKLAMIGGLFLSSPFIMYQVWSFISPGLYKHEKKYAMPFVLFCSVLFLSGGAFAYFVAFPAALRFLLSFGAQFRPMITVDEYFGLAMTIILGLAIVFELPVLVLFMTLLRIVTPGFLLRNFRYAFLVIVIIAAAVTPTSDIVNMMVFAAPLVVLYFLGIGLSYLVLRARGKKARQEES